MLVTRRARVSCGVCSEPEIGCVRRTAVRTRSEHLPDIWGIRGFRRMHICPGNREFCETLPDARAPSHGGNPGSNPGSGTPEPPSLRGFSRSRGRAPQCAPQSESAGSASGWHRGAWTAASLTARGHSFLGPRELVEDRAWSGEISWRDRRGFNTSTHRPDLIGVPGQAQVAIEVELAKKSAERLQSILGLHALARGRADQRRDLHLRRRGRQRADRERGQGIRAPGVVTLMAPHPAARDRQSAGRSSIREAPSGARFRRWTPDA